MTTFFLKPLAGASVIAVLATGAAAATFNFADQYRSSSSSFTMVSGDGLSVTVSGGAYGDGTRTVRTHQNYGLSVGHHMIDTNEYAKFEFSHDVSLDSFYAGYVDMYDDYRIYAKVGGSYTQIQTGDFGATNSSGGNYDRATVFLNGIANDVVSRFFAIGVDDEGDDFKIRKLTAHKVSEVPLPAGGLLLLSGLGFLALRRRNH